MRWPSIFVLIRSDLRARWVGLIALGVLAGVVGALAVGSLSVARRTDTAVTRLSETAGVGDALVNVYGDITVADDIGDLDSVSAAVLLPTWVGLLDGPELQPIALMADAGAPRTFFRPTLVEGRAVDEGAVDEVVMFESFARQTGVEVGTELTLDLLGFDQSFRFGPDLGEPEGSTVQLTIVGTVRTSGVADQMPPLVAGPAFAERYAEDQAGIAFAAVQLHGGADAAPQLESELQALRATASPVPGLADTAVDVTYPDRAGNDSARSSQRLLVSGLLAFAAVVIGAGLLSLGQAMARLNEGTRARASVEAALGLTAVERTLVRAIPGTIVVTVTALVAGLGALAAGLFEPLGALRTYEPHPGFAPNVALAGLGAIVMAVLVGVVTTLTAIPSAGVRQRAHAARPSAAAQRIAATPLRPPVTIGAVMAFEPPRHRGGVPLRSVRVGLVLALTGVVAVLVVTSNLTDLLHDPARFGAAADLVVSDVSDDTMAALLADDRVTDLSLRRSGTITVDGRSLGADAVEDRRGHAGWTLAEGSYPATENEIVLGPRAASKLDRDIGDVVTVADGSDGSLDLRVVGIGLGPETSGGQLGSAVLVAPPTLAKLVEQPGVEGLVRVDMASDADAVLADFAGTAEVHARTVPAEIMNLDEVGALPILLAAFLALVGVSALANGLVVAVRRRRTTIAVLRTMGFTPGQSATTILTMTGAVVLTSTVIGLPLGLLLGAELWRGIAARAAVAPAVSVPTLSILAIGVIGLVIGLGVAAMPAWRAARLHPAEILREP